MQSRVLPFSGIHNFRDYGHYRAKDGAQIKAGILFRSGQHRDATDADLDQVLQLGLAHVIDLRGKSERTNAPCPRPAAFSANVIFADGETAGLAPHLEAARDVRTAEDAFAAMQHIYTGMPFRPLLVNVLQRYFEALGAESGPSLIHCLAGKDRTGVAVALVHDMLGVHADDMMEDYLLTNVAGNIEARIAAGADVVRSGFGKDMTDDAVRTLMSVHKAFLLTAIDAIKARYGDLSTYRSEVLGVTPALEARILRHLLT